jgi:hypothetical protein
VSNASKHKALSYERMKKREEELASEVDRWLAAAEAADAEEDKLHSKTKRAMRCRTGLPIKRSGSRR